jgi:hypothetical protein
LLGGCLSVVGTTTEGLFCLGVVHITINGTNATHAIHHKSNGGCANVNIAALAKIASKTSKFFFIPAFFNQLNP